MEVNSETDFVARNAKFQAFVGDLADATLRRYGDLGAAASAATGAARVDGDALAALALANGEPCADAAAALSAHVGERVVVRRARLLEGDVVGAYAHAAVGPGAGLAASLVALSGDVAGRDAAGLDAVAKAAAMHAVAARPVYLDAGRVPADVLAKEREVLFDQLADSGKPENIVEKIVAARLAKFAGEKSLAGQAHVVEGGKATVAAVVAKALPGFEVSGFALCTVGGDDAAE